MTDADRELLTRYVAGECTPDERLEVERRYPAVARAAALADRTLSDVPRARLKRDMDRRIAAERPAAWAARPSRPLWRIAAAIAVVAGGSLATYSLVRRSTGALPNSPSERTIATARGQRLSLRLPDGTVAVVAPASRLTIPAAYGTSDRRIELDGAAAFTVTHDERRPFVVRAGSLIVKDLGTRFVVRAYRGEGAADVVVAEGRVAVGAASPSIVTPGQGARVDSTGVVSVRAVPDLTPYFGWTEGRLAFRATPLREAVREIVRWHDVTLEIASAELAERRFSGSFRPNESAAQIVGSVAAALQLAVVQTGPSTYLFRSK